MGYGCWLRWQQQGVREPAPATILGGRCNQRRTAHPPLDTTSAAMARGVHPRTSRAAPACEHMQKEHSFRAATNAEYGSIRCERQSHQELKVLQGLQIRVTASSHGKLHPFTNNMSSLRMTTDQGGRTSEGDDLQVAIRKLCSPAKRTQPRKPSGAKAP